MCDPHNPNIKIRTTPNGLNIDEKHSGPRMRANILFSIQVGSFFSFVDQMI